jgi:small subunit ribosomal protein S6
MLGKEGYMVTKAETNSVDQLQWDYELVFIISPEVADDALDPLINNVTQYITGKGGEVVEIARWGRKKLAYPIKHMMEGNYILVKFKLNPSANRELENNLRISEKIIRYLLIKID